MKIDQENKMVVIFGSTYSSHSKSQQKMLFDKSLHSVDCVTLCSKSEVMINCVCQKTLLSLEHILKEVSCNVMQPTRKKLVVTMRGLTLTTQIFGE